MACNAFRVALVLGGARSGKSRYAEALVRASASRVPIYIATAQAGDDEMAQRIAHHRALRGEAWQTIEEPLAIAEALLQAEAEDVVLIDCLTLWLSNLILAERDIDRETGALYAAVQATPARVVLVANEVGLGIVPDNALARHFRDAAGRLNQRLAEIADHVAFIAAGLPMILKNG
jgi:adenosylcobinamide kinase / adenosylcobinamide-phosphate guanylyltransferase